VKAFFDALEFVKQRIALAYSWLLLLVGVQSRKLVSNVFESRIAPNLYSAQQKS
jgi:hypothetical protein